MLFLTTRTHIKLTLTMAAITVCWSINKNSHFRWKSISYFLILTKSTATIFRISNGEISRSILFRPKHSKKDSTTVSVQPFIRLPYISKESPLEPVKSRTFQFRKDYTYYIAVFKASGRYTRKLVTSKSHWI